MRRHLLRTLFAIAPASAATITSVSPQGEVAKVRQITVKFSEAVLPFGDLRLPDPLSLSCQGAVPAGSGRWASDSVWLYDFRDALPPGTRCTLKASVTANAWCEVEGIGERIAVRVIGGEARAQLLKARRIDATQAARTLVLGCQRPLPNSAALRLVWGKGIAAAANPKITTRVEQRFRYTVRPAFTADFSYERERANAPCLPIRPMRLGFSAPVPREWAAKVRLTPASPASPGSASALAPVFDKDDTATDVNALTFPTPLSENAAFTLSLPGDLKDNAGRVLANAASFPLKLATGAAPPIAKFAAAPFGVIEAADPVLPVTLRHVQGDLRSAAVGRRNGGHEALRAAGNVQRPGEFEARRTAHAHEDRAPGQRPGILANGAVERRAQRGVELEHSAGREAGCVRRAAGAREWQPGAQTPMEQRQLPRRGISPAAGRRAPQRAEGGADRAGRTATVAAAELPVGRRRGAGAGACVGAAEKSLGRRQRLRRIFVRAAARRLRVRIEVDAQSDMTWVVVSDPVPGGATILGSGLGRDSVLATRTEQRAGSAWAAYQERSFEAFRSYFEYLPRGKHVIEYSVRLNNPGRFALPQTRVEAMYAPESFGEAPYAAVEVAP